MAQTETNDNRIAVMVDTRSYASKPDSSEVGKVKARMRRRGPVLLSPEDVFQELVSGHSIIPAEMVGGVRSGDWRSQRLFMVDIDGGSTVQEVAERYEDAGLSPAFVYHTYSSAEGCEKFRFAFLADSVVKDGDTRDIIQVTLMGIAGCADEKCADRARYFNGTDKGGEFFGSEVDTERLLSLWDDSYASYLPQIGKKAAKTENTAKKEQKRKSGASGRFYGLSVTDGEIPACSEVWKKISAHNIEVLEAFFELREWREKEHRERFLFLYFNMCAIVYGPKEAYRMAKDLCGRMQDRLADAEIYWAVTHSRSHEEDVCPDLHDGFFLFKTDTMLSERWLDATPGERAALGARGCFATSEKNRRANRNRPIKEARTSDIAVLFHEGKSKGEIKKIVDERYGEQIGTYSIRSIERQIAEIQRDKICDVIPITNKIYNAHAGTTAPAEVPSSVPDGDAHFADNSHSFHQEVRPVEEVDADLALLAQAVQKTVPYYASLTRVKPLIASLPTYDDGEGGVSWDECLDMLLNAKNAIVEGKAGSGKSTLLCAFEDVLKNCKVKVLKTAPTNLAASRIGGKTLHDAFGLEARIYKPDDEVLPSSVEKLKKVHVLVIDEIGNVRVDLFHHVIRIVRKAERIYRRRIQVVCFGDFNQLPPVITTNEREEFERIWKGCLGDSFRKGFVTEDRRVFEVMHFERLRLTGNKRASGDPLFANLCEGVLQRRKEVLPVLNEKVSSDAKFSDKCIHICPTNAEADRVNGAILEMHQDDSWKVIGLPFRVHMWMPVILTKTVNRRFTKGNICLVTHYSNMSVTIRNCHGEYVELKHNSYLENMTGKDYLIPLAPAYAITVHKAQGLSFNWKIAIHPGCFEKNQLYVAVTRTGSFDGIVLTAPLTEADFA